MTVTTNEFGQQNLFAKEPQMYISKTDAERYGYETYAERAEKLNGRTAMLGFVAAVISYATSGSVFFFIVFQPALQNTKGRMVGYKDHKTYGDSSIYENTPSDNTKFFLELGG